MDQTLQIPDQLYVPAESFRGHTHATNEYSLEAYDSPAPKDEDYDVVEVLFLRASNCVPEHVLEWLDARSFAVVEFGPDEHKEAAQKVQDWIKIHKRERSREDEQLKRNDV